MPTIRLSSAHFAGADSVKLNDYFHMHDSLAIQYKLDNGDDVLKKWIQDVKVSNYASKKDKYDILFLLCKQSSKMGQISPQSIPVPGRGFARKYTSGKS